MNLARQSSVFPVLWQMFPVMIRLERGCWATSRRRRSRRALQVCLDERERKCTAQTTAQTARVGGVGCSMIRSRCLKPLLFSSLYQSCDGSWFLLWETVWCSSERHASLLWQQTTSCLGLQSISPRSVEDPTPRRHGFGLCRDACSLMVTSLLVSLANALGGGNTGWMWIRSLSNPKKCRL